MEPLSLETVVTLPTPPPISETMRRRWLTFYSLSTGFSSIAFTNAVWVVYLATHGYSPFAIGLFETLFHVAKFAAEVPTGAFADLVGRRASLIVANTLGVLSNILFFIPTPLSMLLSFALSGIGYAFRSGAGDAIVWSIAGTGTGDSHEGRYSRLFSALVVVMTAGEVLGTASGGFLSGVMVTLPFLAQIVADLIGVAFLTQIPEQRGFTHERPQPLRHIIRGMRAAGRDRLLLGLLVISALSESCFTTMNYYTQLYLHTQGFTLASIGLFVSVALGMNLIVTAFAPRIMRLTPRRWLLPIFLSLQACGMLCLAIDQRAVNLIGYIVIFQSAVAVLYPALSTLTNARSPEAQRATILSFQTGLFSLTMIVLFPLFGLGITHVSYQAVYLWTCVAFITGCVTVFALMQKR